MDGPRITAAFATALLLTASSQAIDETALERLRTAAEESHSDAVVVMQHGEVVADWRFDGRARPIELMSVAKSVVALGIGLLVTDGRVDSLDTPVHAWYPEWKQGRKQAITLRHLLSHTSGLQNNPNAGAEIYPSPDVVRLALAAELDADPGARFSYNNKAVNLLAGIIGQVVGEPMDRYLDRALLAPLGIPPGTWHRDAAGTPHAMAGLRLDARDLARLGQLVLDRGRVGDRQLIDAAYLDAMLAAGQPHYPLCGLLWWRLPRSVRYMLDDARMVELAEAGVDGDVLDRLGPLVGKHHETREGRDAALGAALGDGWREARAAVRDEHGLTGIFRLEHGPVEAYYGEGYLGQFVVVVPSAGLVAVRQIEGGEGYDPATDTFGDFPRHVLALARGAE